MSIATLGNNLDIFTELFIKSYPKCKILVNEFTLSGICVYLLVISAKKCRE